MPFNLIAGLRVGDFGETFVYIAFIRDIEWLTIIAVVVESIYNFGNVGKLNFRPGNLPVGIDGECVFLGADSKFRIISHNAYRFVSNLSFNYWLGGCARFNLNIGRCFPRSTPNKGDGGYSNESNKFRAHTHILI